MKVCIVTVYNSVNSGSFWQAKALQKYLESIGVEVVFFKRKNDLNSSSSVFVQLITLIKKLIKGGPKLLLYYYKQFKEFKSNQKTFKIVNVLIIGFKLGITTLKNVCKGLHPSIIADSSIS